MSISRRNLLAVTATGVVAAAIDIGGIRASAGPAPRTAAGQAAAAAGPVPLTLGVSTWDQTVQRASYTAPGYQTLSPTPGAGEPHVVRTDLHVDRNPPTLALAAFAQMTDLHIVDDQSPGRIEFMDKRADTGAPYFASWPTDSAYRPHEFLSTQVVDAMCLAISSIGKGPYTKLPLAFTIVTGDAVDNCQHNENRWYIDLLDGGQTIVPDSGQIGLDQSLSGGGVLEPSLNIYYYYPDWNPIDLPGNEFTGSGEAGFPRVQGLLQGFGLAHAAARRPYVSHGLGMPWYAAYGNHDGMWQGNEPIDNNVIDVNALVIGSAKTVDTTQPLPDLYDDLGILNKFRAARNLVGLPVAPDANRRLLSRKAFIEDHFNTAGTPVGHGFQGVGVDKAYYAIPFADTDLVRYITLDSTNTNTDGFGSGNASGSIDLDQFNWLEQQLIANSSTYADGFNQVHTQSGVSDKLYVIFCHHTLGTMDNINQDTVIGTTSAPRTGDDLKALLLRFPNVIAMVNGHTHANKITPHQAQSPNPFGGTGFWEISTASHIDWPIQSRIIEIAASPDVRNAGEFGNGVGPGTISIFTTMVDPAAPLAYGGDLSNTSQLASLARELATNDPQEVAVKPGHAGIKQRMGVEGDRNTQLLLAAPFQLFAPRQEGSPIAVARNADGRLELFGTDASDNLWNTSQRTPSGDLKAWTKLSSGPGWRSVTAASHQDGRIELFALLNSTVTRRTQTTAGSSTYTGNHDFDDFFTSVAATLDPWGGMNVYATHDDHTIWHRDQDVVNNDTAIPGWATPWDQLGGTAIQLAVETGSDGHGVMVAIREDGSLFYRKMITSNAQGESAWGPILPLDGALVSIDLARNLDGRLVIFGIDVDGRLFQRFETAAGSGTWQPWSQIATQLGTTAPTTTLRMRHIAAERSGPGRIELFAVDATGMLYHAKQSNPNIPSWPTWQSLAFHLRASHSLGSL